MSGSCVLYLRSAAPSDARIRKQKEILKNYAAQRGYKVSRIFVDNGISGATIDERDGLSSALNYIKVHPEVKALIVENGDRLTRNVSDHQKIQHFLYSHDVGLLTPSDAQRHGVSADFLFSSQMAAFNEYWSKITSEKVRRALRMKAARGETPFSLPMGYQRKGQTVEINKNSAKVVEQIFKLYQSEKYTLSALATHLNNRNLQTSKGNRFTSSSLRSILKNPYYIGQIPFGGELFKGNHKKIVSTQIFDRCQKLTEARRLKLGQKFLNKAL